MSDIKALQSAYEKKQQELQELERELRVAEAQKFKNLPQSVGLKSIDSLLEALAPYASPRLKGRLKPIFSAPGAVVGGKRLRKQKGRGRIDDAVRDRIVGLLKQGTKTASAIASEFGVSAASVNLIKKAAGLTKARKKRSN